MKLCCCLSGRLCRTGWRHRIGVVQVELNWFDCSYKAAHRHLCGDGRTFGCWRRLQWVANRPRWRRRFDIHQRATLEMSDLVGLACRPTVFFFESLWLVVGSGLVSTNFCSRLVFLREVFKWGVLVFGIILNERSVHWTMHDLNKEVMQSLFVLDGDAPQRICTLLLGIMSCRQTTLLDIPEIGDDWSDFVVFIKLFWKIVGDCGKRLGIPPSTRWFPWRVPLRRRLQF